MIEGGGRDLETAKAFGKKIKKPGASMLTPTLATITLPSKVNISSPYLTKPIKIEIPSLAASTSTFKKITVVKQHPQQLQHQQQQQMITKINVMPAKPPMRFVPPKVNTANNRVSSTNTSNNSGGSGMITISCI